LSFSLSLCVWLRTPSPPSTANIDPHNRVTRQQHDSRRMGEAVAPPQLSEAWSRWWHPRVEPRQGRCLDPCDRSAGGCRVAEARWRAGRSWPHGQSAGGQCPHLRDYVHICRAHSPVAACLMGYL
jgi:hypothetical protein